MTDAKRAGAGDADPLLNFEQQRHSDNTQKFASSTGAPLILHPFQCEAVDRVEQELEDHRKVLLVAPTGAGKTVIASEIIKRAVAKYRPVLFLAHRREIIQQTSTKLMAKAQNRGAA